MFSTTLYASSLSSITPLKMPGPGKCLFMIAYMTGVVCLCTVVRGKGSLADEFVNAAEEAQTETSEVCHDLDGCGIHTLQQQPLDDLASHIERLSELTHSPPVAATDIADHLDSIVAQLRSGTLRTGVVGLTKAGKSTTLNALLGKSFLPSSIQPQTAKEVRIIHDPSTPNGILSAVLEGTDTTQQIVASGEDVLEYLYQINNNIREKQTTFQKLILQAPFPFLSNAEGITLEISDTPGLFEATDNDNITAESRLVVKEQFAFAIILNLKLLKTKGESELLRMLSTHHPELFVKLNRILVLVNAYDDAFHNTNTESLRPDGISSYVSEYLAEPEILNATISPENILPFSALWALRSRLWSADPSSLLHHPDATNLYEESLIILRRAGFRKEVEPLSALSEDNILAITPLLLKFSKIETIEKRLKEMLQLQGPQVLLDAAVEDSVTAGDKILFKISTKIDELELNKKQFILSKLEELIKAFKDLKAEHFSRVAQIPGAVHASIAAELSSVSNSAREAIDVVISTQLTNHLQGYHGMEDRNAVFGRICAVKGLIAQPAHGEMTKRWNGLNSVVRNALIENIRGLLSELKSRVSSFQLADSTAADEMPIIANLVSEVSSKVIRDLDNVEIPQLVSNFIAMNLHIDGGSIPNNQLDHIWQRAETKYRKERRTKKKKSGFLGLGRKRVEWYESVPYQVQTYGPNIDALKNSLAAQATNLWMTKFQVRVETAIAEMSRSASELVRKVCDDVLSSAEQEVQRSLEGSRETVHNAQLMNTALIASKHDVEEIIKSVAAQRRA